MAVGHISGTARKQAKFFGAGCALFALSGIPYIAFNRTRQWDCFWNVLLYPCGIIAIVVSMFVSKDEYKVLKREPLLWTTIFERADKRISFTQEKESMLLPLSALFCFIAGLLVLAVTVRGIFPWTDYHVIVFLALAVGIFGVVFSAGVMEAYEILVHNDNHSNSVWFKIKRKVKSKIDKW